ncbi:MAG TPA: hypothetical protein PLX89_14465 [Verrucomicrobiota bacterium]|nr:hypothetical protein [Verrucomicrobiales bacterium]HRI14196.1 hypothetical protein [Verrucomicrobiota bacterium]
MKTAPNEPNLLEDVLSESAPAVDSLGPMLRAVRARRRCRHAGNSLAVLLAVGLAWTWLGPLGRPSFSGSIEPTDSAPLASVAPALFSGVRTVALADAERVTTSAGSQLVARVSTQAERGLQVSDGELFMLAGGRGVGLFRLAARTEFLIARSVVH